MLEQEYTYDEISDYICSLYPNLYLDTPIEFPDYGMNDYEGRFLELLIDRGMIVYREPYIEDLDCVPDFFVFNPRTMTGKIVEITLLYENRGNGNSDRKTRLRKQRQKERIEESGIPAIFLYREHLERIRESCCENLF